MIQLKDISLSLSDKRIFDNFNLTIAKGEKLGITGPSGRGKTTLLKILAGIQSFDSGNIIINDIQYTSNTITQVSNRFIWIPQNINLPVNTGKELLEMMNVKSNIREVYSFLQKLNLDSEILEKSFTQISGGEKQRIIISICLSLSGDIILIDEPTSALDKSSTKALLDLIQSIEGKTIISVSHDPYWINNFENTLSL